MTTQGSSGTRTTYDGIVVGVDHNLYSWEAIPAATVLADAAGLPVRLFHALAGNSPVRPELREAADEAQLPLDVAGGARTTADRAQLLLSHAVEQNLLPAVTTHGRRGVTESVLGSVAIEILRRAARPVLLFGPHHREEPESPKRVLCSVDGSDFSETVVGEAARWAGQLAVPLWLIQVIESSGAPVAQEDSYLRNLASDMASIFGEIEWDVLHGKHAGSGVADYANEVAGTLLVMSTHARTGMDRFTRGSVTGEVLRHVRGPVLAFNPHGVDE